MNLIDILSLLLLSVMSALIGFGFNKIQDHDMLLEWYPDFLTRLIYVKNKNLLFDIETQAMGSSDNIIVAKTYKKRMFWHYITKPLGLCIVCNTVWIGMLLTLVFVDVYTWKTIVYCIITGVTSGAIVIFLTNKYKQLQKSI